MLQTTSTERRAAGGDRPRSGGSVKMRPLRLLQTEESLNRLRAMRQPERLSHLGYTAPQVL